MMKSQFRERIPRSQTETARENDALSGFFILFQRAVAGEKNFPENPDAPQSNPLPVFQRNLEQHLL